MAWESVVGERRGEKESADRGDRSVFLFHLGENDEREDEEDDAADDDECVGAGGKFGEFAAGVCGSGGLGEGAHGDSLFAWEGSW